MRNKIEHLLLRLLWVLIVTLGTIFWFNSQYGFNILSASHWEHLSYLQASQTPIKSGFYISLSVVMVIVIVGLYLLMRPHFIRLHMYRKKKKSLPPVSKIALSVSQPRHSDNIISVQSPITQIQPEQKVQHTSPGPSGIRPPRLNTGIEMTRPVLMPQPVMQPAPQPSATAMQQIDSQLRQIFNDAGYITKVPPRISGVQTSLLAIGSDETLWMGGAFIATNYLARAVDNLSQVFSDTLDDIDININTFIIGAPDAAANTTNALMFANIDELRNYINAHPNSTPSDQDAAENMNAYSEYIDTVLTYIGKI